MLLPGPEATQLATYLGWLMHGVPGGLMAGGLFLAPSVLVLTTDVSDWPTEGATTVVETARAMRDSNRSGPAAICGRLVRRRTGWRSCRREWKPSRFMTEISSR